MKKLTHPLGKVQSGTKAGPPAKTGLAAAVAALKPAVKLPMLAAQASNTTLRKG
jgi:hypothetical protein